ncbi:MAG: metallophosphoesterase [Patescibacteria group bacterium]|nr:MAG: metallophosphoesterase [Patescibacteria group bacterium]
MPGKYSKPVYVLDLPWQIFDLAIVSALAFFSAAFFWSRSVEGSFGILVMLASAAGFATIFYGSFIEPRRLRVRRYSVGAGERSLTVAFLSDIHVGPYKGRSWVRHVARKTQALKPDVLLLGGDFLYEKAEALPHLAPLKDMRAPLGVYAILGNHDEWKSRTEALAWFEASGIPLLHNRSARVEKDGASVVIAGAEDDWYGETDLAAALRDVGMADLSLVMLHNPDLAHPSAALLQARSGKTVFFSGHTHGGQIRLPFVGSVMRLPHYLGRRYDRGVFSFDGVPLVLGAGLGESGPRARLFCPPEIVLVTVRF